MTKLIAKERFFYAGRNVEKDEEFEAEQQDVALLTDVNTPRARLVEAKPHQQAKAKTVETRALEAAAPETTTVTPMTTAELPEATMPRRYNRRDMRSKE